jgi:hypothetical protein
MSREANAHKYQKKTSPIASAALERNQRNTGIAPHAHGSIEIHGVGGRSALNCDIQNILDKS